MASQGILGLSASHSHSWDGIVETPISTGLPSPVSGINVHPALLIAAQDPGRFEGMGWDPSAVCAGYICNVRCGRQVSRCSSLLLHSIIPMYRCTVPLLQRRGAWIASMSGGAGNLSTRAKGGEARIMARDGDATEGMLLLRSMAEDHDSTTTIEKGKRV